MYLLVRPEPEPSVAALERPKHRVVILGGGFGGVSVAKRLEQIYSRDDSMEPTFPIWLNIPLSKSSAFFKPLSICETLAVGMAIITP